MSQLLPQIGTMGSYILSDPLASLIASDIMLECVSIRKLGEIIASGRDPFEVYYVPLNISRDIYAEHSMAGSYVVGLRTEAGRMFHIPSPFIKEFPIPGGVAYENYVLAVSIGALPKDMPLTHLQQAVHDLVKDTIGTNAKSKIVKVSQTSFRTSSDHDAIQAAREALIKVDKTDRMKAIEAQREAEELRDYNNALMEHILILQEELDRLKP